MAKPKGQKLGISFLNSFQICRPKNPSSMVECTLRPAVTYMYSPLNSKSFDISFPSFPGLPPSTPSKITPLAPCGCPSRSHTLSKSTNEEKVYNSPVSSDSDEILRPTAPSRTEKKDGKSTTRKSKASDDYYDFNHIPLKTIAKKDKKPVKPTSVTRARRVKRFGEDQEMKPNSSGRLVGGKLLNHESCVVVKSSVDPYEDFKKSMLEMIMEKQIFEPRELEQLLLSFISLNSRQHHTVIIEAFTEILKQVFCG